MNPRQDITLMVEIDSETPKYVVDRTVKLVDDLIALETCSVENSFGCQKRSCRIKDETGYVGGYFCHECCEPLVASRA